MSFLIQGFCHVLLEIFRRMCDRLGLLDVVWVGDGVRYAMFATSVIFVMLGFKRLGFVLDLVL